MAEILRLTEHRKPLSFDDFRRYLKEEGLQWCPHRHRWVKPGEADFIIIDSITFFQPQPGARDKAALVFKLLKQLSMKLKPLLLLLVLLISGCRDENSPLSLANTEKYFANPTEVGTLPDGRVVKCVWRDMGENTHAHCIYFVDNTITVNRSVQAGKTTRNDVSVMIDGVKYIAAPTAEKP
jgi:hypothetical protein